MAEISPQRIILQQEEVAFKSSVSEGILSRVGATTNFINRFQYDSRGFFLNGPYSILGPQAGVDGAWGVLFNVDIVGIMMFNLVAGSSGTTTLDIVRFTASGVSAGSIFSTKPSLAFTSGNNAFVFQDTLTPVTLEAPTGSTVPVLSTTQLNAGDMLVMNKDDSQVGGENAGLLIYYRPR